MNIKDPVFQDTVKRIESYEERLYAHPLHKDPDLDHLYSLYVKKLEVSIIFAQFFPVVYFFLYPSFTVLLPLFSFLFSFYLFFPSLNLSFYIFYILIISSCKSESTTMKDHSVITLASYKQWFLLVMCLNLAFMPSRFSFCSPIPLCQCNVASITFKSVVPQRKVKNFTEQNIQSEIYLFVQNTSFCDGVV